MTTERERIQSETEKTTERARVLAARRANRSQDRTCPSCGHATVLLNQTNGQRFCSRAVDGRCNYIGIVTHLVQS